MKLEAVPYEEHRKRYFKDLLAQKHRQLDYWAKRDDFTRLEDIGMEISYIEDAIKALEKQIPKKFIIIKDRHIGCCACGFIIELFHADVEKYPFSHCPNCGQLLDWSLQYDE